MLMEKDMVEPVASGAETTLLNVTTAKVVEPEH